MRDEADSDGSIGLINRLIAGAIGLLTVVAILIWGTPPLDPSMWDEVAAVAKIRPPHAIFPGFWRVLTGWVFGIVGIDGSLEMLTFIGALGGGVCVALFYLITRQILALLIRTQKRYRVWAYRIAPFFAAVASIAFGMSAPLWRVARVFSPDEIRLLMFLGIVYVSLRWFVVGGRWRLFPLWGLMGFMAAETPFAFLLPSMFIISYGIVWHCVLDMLFVKPVNFPEPGEMPKWRMFFLFLGGLALGVWVNAANFVALGGIEANGWNESDIYFRYALGYWHVFVDAASIIGWVLGLCFGVLPFVVAARIFPLAVRDDRQMPFNFGVIMFFIGVMALMQCGAFRSTRFWTFTEEEVLVQSGFLLAFFEFCSMLALSLFGAGFTMECQRKYLTTEDVKPGKLLKGFIPMLFGLLLVLIFLRAPEPVVSEMQSIVNDAVAEIVEESGDAKWIFTDGRLDAAIELEARRRGKDLRTLNMMSGATEWELFVRRRGFAENSPDWQMAEIGIPAMLRVWAGEKTNGMEGVALQLGFEFWKRDNKKLPKCSGMLAREIGMSDATAKDGIERTKALSERILAISPEIAEADPSPALASAFSAVNWRISRFARYRADGELANKLDLSNSALKKMLSLIEYERMRTFMQMTPREGLQIALRRADFAEARRYSAAVLRNDEDDAEANFGMGMSALSIGRYEEAEQYLSRCLIRRPDEPAVLNNLSIIYRKLQKFDKAVEFAKRAIKRLPDSPEVKQTLEDALKKAP